MIATILTSSPHTAVQPTMGKRARKALKKARRKLRKALKATSLHELAIAVGMAKVAVDKARTIAYGVA